MMVDVLMQGLQARRQFTLPKWEWPQSGLLIILMREIIKRRIFAVLVDYNSALTDRELGLSDPTKIKNPRLEREQNALLL